MLEQEAAARWGVAVGEVKADNHEVAHQASGRRLGFGALAQGAASRPVPAREALAFKAPEQFRYIGRDRIALVDNLDITTGKAVFGIDARVEGMAYAVVARPPVLGGKVRSVDAAEALKVPGVLKIVPIDAPQIPSAFQPLGGIAVVAENTFAAIKGRSRLQIEWDDGPNGSYDSVEYRKALEAASMQPGKVVRDDGDAYAALASASRRVEASYYILHLAQAPMEPPTATARVTGDECEVWSSVQAPEAIRTDLSKRFGIPLEKVTVHTLLLGGGFGRKSKPDFASEAAILSHAMGGRPVKLVFTREDDIQHSFFHTVSVERLEAGLDAAGKPVAWLHRTAAPTITSIFMPDPKQEAAFELGMGVVDLPFAIPDRQGREPRGACPYPHRLVPVGLEHPPRLRDPELRGRARRGGGRDPEDYLLELIGPDRNAFGDRWAEIWNYGEDPKLYPFETGRLQQVIERAAGEAGWGRTLPAGHGLGIAAHRSFVGYTAVVAEVAIGDGGVLTHPRVDIAFDCGAVVNPDRVRSQLEGAVVQGISLATLGEISFRNGRAEQTNFDGYEVTRIDAAPRRSARI